MIQQERLKRYYKYIIIHFEANLWAFTLNDIIITWLEPIIMFGMVIGCSIKYVVLLHSVERCRNLMDYNEGEVQSKYYCFDRVQVSILQHHTTIHR